MTDTISFTVGNDTINFTVGTDSVSITSGTDSVSITASGLLTTPYVDEDANFYFDGASGDTYLKYNSTTSKLELWVDGVKKQQW